MKKTEKIRFEIDPHNRLVYEKTGGKPGVPGFRTVIDGKFEIDKDNQLTYLYCPIYIVQAGEDLGIDVKLSKKVLEGQGEAFIRALKSQKEVSIAAGAGFKW